ncbi:MAG: hypothetical protein E7288_01815 [Lachnospiraceae bacterium]|nr:hypothetical protein [Lachnospiraceae bacterium]
MDTELLFQVMSEKELDIEKRVLALIENIDEDLYADVTARLTEIDAESKLKIAFVGQHNAGKSTIVSALTNDASIKISSNVETDTTTAYRWGDVYLYDTPGLRAGVKAEHDASALEAIKEADLLVFCITSSLFDDVAIKDFVNLAYDRNYKCKMILVINKMSQEDSDFEELVTNYARTLAETLAECGGNLEDFPVVYIDAKDYKDGVSDEDEELIAFSHFASFTQLLNAQISDKGLVAKVLTKCSVLLDAVTTLVSSTGTEADKNMGTLLNQLKRKVRKQKQEMRSELATKKINLRTEIVNIGDEITSKIGIEEIKDADYEAVEAEIEKILNQTVGEIEEMLEEANKIMIEEMGDVLTADIGSYVYKEVSGGKYSAKSKISVNYSNLLKRVSDAARKIGIEDEQMKQMTLEAQKEEEAANNKLTNLVINVSRFFGKGYMPFKILKITSKIGALAKLLGPIVSVIELAADIVDLVQVEKRKADIKKSKKISCNAFSAIASDIINEIEKQYDLMEKETFDAILADIDKMQDDLVDEAETNSACVGELKQISNELRSLMNAM